VEDWKVGRVEEGQAGKMEGWESPLRNMNRGYRKLTVWQDAVDYYAITSRIFASWPYEMRRVAGNQIAAADSIHRNIAEGYCRRSIKEYLQALNYALGSAGESVSGLHAYVKAKQITQEAFAEADQVVYKLENGLMRLIESLQRKRDAGDWNDSFVVHESNAAYGAELSHE
jgi:four helix bundle protein